MDGRKDEEKHSVTEKRFENRQLTTFNQKQADLRKHYVLSLPFYLIHPFLLLLHPPPSNALTSSNLFILPLFSPFFPYLLFAPPLCSD